MLKMKEIEIEGQIMSIPDIKIGDKIDIMYDSRYDNDFDAWNDEYEGELIVTEVDNVQGMVWLKDCPYGVSMEIITNVR